MTFILVGANFVGRDLSGHDLRGADLSGAIFHGTNLRETDLRDAVLRDADLSEARNLLPHQLAGADLTRAKLTENVAKFEALSQVSETSRNAATLFLTLLVTCSYVGLTAASTTDPALFLAGATTALPAVNVNIPTTGFFFFAPLLLLAVYLYFHLYVLRLGEGIGNLPAIFPDGETLERKLPPWLLNGLFTAHLRLLQRRRPAFTRLQVRVSLFLSWWLVPVTLYGVAERYQVSRDPVGAVWHSLLITMAIALPWVFGRSARQSFTHQRPLTSPADQARPAIQPSWQQLYPIVASSVLFLLLLMLAKTGMRWRGPNLYGLDLSQRPNNWTGDPAQYERVIGAVLAKRQLDEADLRFTFLANAYLRGASLRHAKLSKADLQRADLSGANLYGAILYGAKLREALIRDSDLRDANLEDADLTRATLHRANLWSARFHGANLQLTDLTASNLQGASLGAASLTGADLRDANLWMASLEGADLSGALYNARTRWPKDFDPVKAGAILKDTPVQSYSTSDPSTQ